MVTDWWDHAADKLQVAIVLLGCFTGITITCWQVYKWLEFGVWIKVPIAYGLESFGLNLSLIYNPNKWFGLAKLGEWILSIPLALAIPALGWLVSEIIKNIIQDESYRNINP